MRILIKNGRIIDPANQIDSKLDLLTDGGKIAAMLTPFSEELPNADRVIDAAGQIVCPGFIDLHMHEDPVGDDGHIRQCIFPAMLRMGVTTVLAGNCGENLTDPAAYLRLVEEEGAAVNVAMLAGHSYFRQKAGVTGRHQKASPQQTQCLMEGITAALSDGCAGISFGLRYVPGTTTEEFLSAASCVRRISSRRLITAHIRDDAAYVFRSLAEFALAGREGWAPLQVSHIGSMAGFGQMERFLEQLDALKAGGMDIAADCYPYDAFSTSIGAATYDEGWQLRYGCGYDAVEICEGKYAGMRCTADMFEEMRRDHPQALTVCHVMKSEDIQMALAHPGVIIASDGLLSNGQGHPRAAGTFPRFLRQVLGRQNASLSDAIARITSLPAARLGLAGKGNLKAGSDADIVIFDPEQLRDRSTFQDPMAPPEGISHVLIGGEAALENGHVRNDRAGRAVRFS